MILLIFRQPEQGSAYRPRPSFKRQNPFIQLLTEGKKLRENARDKEWSDEEYLAKLKEIRQMNAKEKRLLYEKYGRARSSLAKVEMEAAKIKSGNGNAATTSAVAVCFDLFSDILNSNSGRKTVNSDTYIMTDLKNEEIIKSDSDDDHDVTIIPPIKSRCSKIFKKYTIATKNHEITQNAKKQKIKRNVLEGSTTKTSTFSKNFSVIHRPEIL